MDCQPKPKMNPWTRTRCSIINLWSGEDSQLKWWVINANRSSSLLVVQPNKAARWRHRKLCVKLQWESPNALRCWWRNPGFIWFRFAAKSVVRCWKLKKTLQWKWFHFDLVKNLSTHLSWCDSVRAKFQEKGTKKMFPVERIDKCQVILIFCAKEAWYLRTVCTCRYIRACTRRERKDPTNRANW